MFRFAQLPDMLQEHFHEGAEGRFRQPVRELALPIRAGRPLPFGPNRSVEVHQEVRFRLYFFIDDSDPGSGRDRFALCTGCSVYQPLE